MNLSKLSNLESLTLRNNALTGSIPTELGQLTKLTFLNLHNSALTGTLPVNLSKLSNLEELYLRLNHLTGPIPTAYKDLTALSIIRIFYNESVCLPKIPDDMTDPDYTDISALHTWYNGIGNKDWVAVHCAYEAPTSTPTPTPGGHSMTLNWSA